MNPTKETVRGDRKPRFDLSDAVGWVEGQFETKPPANDMDNVTINVTTGANLWWDQSGTTAGTVDISSGEYTAPSIVNKVRTEVVDPFPIPDGAQGDPVECTVDTSGLGGNLTDPPVRVDSPRPLEGGESGTVVGRAPGIPSDAEQELYTTIRDVSLSYFSLTVEGTIEQKGRVTGRVSATSGTIDVYIETDQLYHQGSGSVQSDGTFDVEFDRSPDLSEDTLRVDHSSTRLWSNDVEGDYIFSNYRVVPYLIEDQYYEQGQEFVFVDGRDWSHDAVGGSGVWAIELQKNGSKVGVEWRDFIGDSSVYDNIELVAWQVRSFNANDPDPADATDVVNVREDGTAVFTPQGLNRPYRLGVWHDGGEAGPRWHEDVNGSSHYDELYISQYLIGEVPNLEDQIIVPQDGSFEYHKRADMTIRFDVDDLSGTTFEWDFDDPHGTRNRTIARWQTDVGLPISYQIKPEDDLELFPIAFAERTYTYGCALVLLWACYADRQTIAEDVVRGMVTFQEDDALWPFFVTVGQFTDPYRYERVGASMWANYALIEFCDTYPNSSWYSAAKQAVDDSMNRIINEYKTTDSTAYNYPLYRGGIGTWDNVGTDDVTFNPDYVAPWVSTEHTVDCFFAFLNYYETFGGQTWYDRAQEVYDESINVLWSTEEERYWQGAGEDSADTRGALDVHSWGSVMLHEAGDTTRRDMALERIPIYLTTNEEALNDVRGYPPFIEEEGHDVDDKVVWFEGTFGVGFAYRRAGQKGRGLAVNHNVAVIQTPDGGYRYALREEDHLSTFPSIASTVWGLIALRYPEQLWSESL